MFKWIKGLFFSVLVFGLLAFAGAFVVLNQSLPQLDGTVQSKPLSQPAKLERDDLGQAVIHAATRDDAAYALGFAHAQDRFFQMDIQRRVAAGELSVWVGKRAIMADKKARFHQFRNRAQHILSNLPAPQRRLLTRYSQGVNDALLAFGSKPPEYWLTNFDPAPWSPEDSLLVVFSMYLDLQAEQLELDLARTGVARYFGPQMLPFLQQSSSYQAALDGSRIAPYSGPVPPLDKVNKTTWHGSPPPEVGSNNWAVSGKRTDSGSAMLANDMHLGLRVPTTWYRTQLNYTRNNTAVQLTGVSLPGLPGIVVGTNGHVAWGFTNANLDNVDWVALPEDTSTSQPYALSTWQQDDHFTSKEETVEHMLTLSQYGPVRVIDNQRYALKWVAHQPYAINLNIADMDLAQNVAAAVEVAHRIRIPLQNMVIADAAGAIAWTPAGALTGRSKPTATAIAPDQLSAQWATNETNLPVIIQPDSGRIWTANSRVVSTGQLNRYGDGGYALGARAQQIRDRLFDRDTFTISDFYQIQLDNDARFLAPWHALLTRQLQQRPNEFAEELNALANWQHCACAESVGYTLVSAFRQDIMNRLLSPVMHTLSSHGYQPNSLLRQAEPAVWQLINTEPDDWLPPGYQHWDNFYLRTWHATKARLFAHHNTHQLSQLTWGKVNQLRVAHPFADTLPLLQGYLNMPSVAGFGDRFMPAVQQPGFGASQRLFVQPGNLDTAVLTLPGGQSGHPLSSFYRTGFNAYAEEGATPLLPGPAKHTLHLEVAE